MDRKIQQRYRGERREEESERKDMRSVSTVLREEKRVKSENSFRTDHSNEDIVEESLRMNVKNVNTELSEDSGNTSLSTSTTESRGSFRSCEFIGGKSGSN